MQKKGGGVSVEKEPSKGGYRVHYTAVSPNKHKVVKRSFIYNVSSSAKSKREVIDENLIEGVLEKILGEKPEAVLYRKKPHEIRMELVHQINRIVRSSKRGKYLKQFGFGEGKKEKERGGGEVVTLVPRGEENNQEVVRENEKTLERDKAAGTVGGEEGGGGGMQQQDVPMPPKSMFAAEKESANTKVFLAPSFSGKTTLMVDELNKLSKRELEEYDKILLFTESTASAPLKKLDKKVVKKMMIFDRFIPQFVRILKKINTVTKNRYRFLLLLDDCLNLKGGILIKLILTLRNANISTVISIQYSKLLSRSQRQSIHDYYLINLKIEDLEYLMSGFLASHFRDLFEREGVADRETIHKLSYKKLAEKGMDRLKGKILHFNQRKDEITIHTRK
jgi:hypothetical protein